MGKLAGVISHDENVKNQFKYTNIPDPAAAPDTGSDAADNNKDELNTLLLEIQNNILQKTDPAIISPKLDSVIEEIKKMLFLTGRCK